MKPLYTYVTRVLAALIFLTGLSSTVKSQPLVAGDIAFTGYHSNAGTDSFSFVVLRSLSAGTVINFTDNGWLNPGVFRAGESHITFTSVALPAGREVVVALNVGTSTARQAWSGGSAGTIAYTAGPNPMAFATAGDQIIAYTGTIAAPTFIAGLHMNMYSADILECGNTTDAAWDPDCFDGAGGTVGNTSFSKLPAGLTPNTNALFFATEGVNTSDRDNARFTGCGLNLSTPALARAAINNKANWGQSSSTNPPGFPLGSGCTFLGLVPLPVSLISFTGKLNSDKTVSLQWKVAMEQDVSNYIVEESADGINFTQLGIVAAANMDTYSFADMQVATGNNYYRLKITDIDGSIAYSEIRNINLKAGIRINVYPNPVTDQLTIQQFGNTKNTSATLSDGHGKTLQQVRINSQTHSINMETYPAGMYVLKMEDGTVFKVMKQ